MKTGLQVMNEINDRIGYKQLTTIEGTLDNRARKMLRLMNRVLKNLTAAETWPMLRKEGTLLTQAPTDDTMLVELTNGSTTVSISQYDTSGVTWLETNMHWAIQFGPLNPIYRIVKVNSTTSIELNRPWIGDTLIPVDPDTTDDNEELRVVFAMDRYVMPEDFDRPAGKWEDFLSVYNVSPMGAEDFAKIRRARGRTIDYEDPRYYTIHGLDPSNTYQMLHLEPWPKQQTMMVYEYQMVHPEIETDADLVLFPIQHHGVVIESVLHFANRDYEDDTRMQAALQEYLMQFNVIKGNNNITQDVKRISPANRARARSIRQRADGGVRWDYGAWFDRVDFVDLP